MWLCGCGHRWAVTPKQVMMGWSALETMPKSTGSACATMASWRSSPAADAGTLLKKRSETLRSKTMISLSLERMLENMPMAPCRMVTTVSMAATLKGDAGDADERADAMPAEIGEDQLEEDHDRSLVPASSAISQALSVTARSSPSRSLRSLRETTRPGAGSSRRWRVRSPIRMSRFEALDGAADANGTGDIGSIEELVAGGGLAGLRWRFAERP